jgi:hypothetical protein
MSTGLEYKPTISKAVFTAANNTLLISAYLQISGSLFIPGQTTVTFTADGASSGTTVSGLDVRVTEQGSLRILTTTTLGLPAKGKTGHVRVETVIPAHYKPSLAPTSPTVRLATCWFCISRTRDVMCPFVSGDLHRTRWL